MILNDLEHYIEQEWDSYVAASQDPVTLKESRDALIPKVAAYLESADRDFESEAKTYINSTLRKVREGRTNQLKRDLEWVLDYMSGPDTGTLGVIAMLDRAYPMGLRDGEDKALRYWTSDDVQNKITTRYRVAADATAEARDFDAVGTDIILRMQSENAKNIGDLTGLTDARSEAVA